MDGQDFIYASNIHVHRICSHRDMGTCVSHECMDPYLSLIYLVCVLFLSEIGRLFRRLH
jgi:hypothetical protein